MPDLFDKVRLAHLRAELSRTRLEKLSLAQEIQARTTSASQKHEAARRYYLVNAEMKNIADELKEFLAATKYSLAARGIL
ncbi:MAG: hypothetical protein WCC26_01130 [Terracidiphilus sp.]